MAEGEFVMVEDGTSQVLAGVREYSDGYPVEVVRLDNGRRCVRAWNQGGYDHVLIDIDDLFAALAVLDNEGGQ